MYIKIIRRPGSISVPLSNLNSIITLKTQMVNVYFSDIRRMRTTTEMKRENKTKIACKRQYTDHLSPLQQKNINLVRKQ
jgi:hypothetical protein